MKTDIFFRKSDLTEEEKKKEEDEEDFMFFFSGFRYLFSCFSNP